MTRVIENANVRCGHGKNVSFPAIIDVLLSWFVQLLQLNISHVKWQSLC